MRHPIAVLMWLVFAIVLCPLITNARDDKFERGRMEEILDLVSKDVQKNFYDPNMKGLDWSAVTEHARQRIRQAEHLDEMIAAIASVPYQLQDSHTFFIPPDRTAKAEYGFKAEPIGDQILVYEVEKDGPAAKAGLQLGDQIIAVNNFGAKRENFFEMMRYFVFLNPSMTMDLDVVQPPRRIKIPTHVEQRAKALYMDYNELMREWDARESFYTHKEYDGQISYIKLRTFAVPPGEISSVVNKVKNSSAVILDLRQNPGGALEMLTSLAGSFTDDAYDIATQITRKNSERIHVKPVHPRISSPLFVLVDSGSGSASEMLARDLQWHRRATVVGDRTSGRVNSARLFWEKVGAGYAVAFGTEIAVARVVMADGEELENRGVTPDEFCLPTSNDLREARDPCLERVLTLAKQSTSVPHLVDSQTSK